MLCYSNGTDKNGPRVNDITKTFCSCQSVQKDWLLRKHNSDLAANRMTCCVLCIGLNKRRDVTFTEI